MSRAANSVPTASRICGYGFSVIALASYEKSAITGIPFFGRFQVIHPTLLTAIAFGIGLLLIDAGAWRLAARMFDRERLVRGQPTKHFSRGNHER